MKPPKQEPTPAEPSGFAKLDLSAPMLAALALAGYEQPTPVQAGLIPRALAGVDVMAQARTGTGKTASFAIPILEKLTLHKHSQGPHSKKRKPHQSAPSL